MNVAKARSVEVDCKRKRSMLVKFRGGTAELRIAHGIDWPCGLRWTLDIYIYIYCILPWQRRKDERVKL